MRYSMAGIVAAGLLATLGGCNAYPRDYSRKSGTASSAPAPVVLAAARAEEPAPAPAPAKKQRATSSRYGKPGYSVYEIDGRLWVFRTGSKEHDSFLTKGESAKRVTRISSGPGGKTLVGASTPVLESYEALWPKAAAPAAQPRRSMAGGMTSASPYGVHGFAVFEDDGRLWVFRKGSKHLTTYKTKGEPAKRVTLIAEGPQGKTLMGSDTEAMKDYAASFRYAWPGFAVYGDDGRLWVFRRGSSAHQTFLTKGEPAKRVTLIGEGPDGITLLGAERATLDSYLRARAR